MQSPFKFLDPYEAEDHRRFFGREKETAQLYNAVFAANLTLLYGGSGTGKTSLVNCGLANMFYPTDWLPIFIRREQNINDSLQAALRAQLPHPIPEDWADRSVSRQIETLYQQYYRPVYLIFDQFEELFIMGTQTEQQQFYETIAGLIGMRSSGSTERPATQAAVQAKVLLIIREEWIAHLNEFEQVIPQLFDNRLRVERMNDRSIARVIAGTIAQIDEPRITIEQPPVTIPKIIENLRDKHQRVDLTNLQVYLDRLYRRAIKRQADNADGPLTFDPELVDSVGRIDNVLGVFLEEQMIRLEEELQSRGANSTRGLPLEILFTLVTEDGTKRQMSDTDILEALPRNRQLSESQLRYCLEELQRLRLLRGLES